MDFLSDASVSKVQNMIQQLALEQLDVETDLQNRSDVYNLMHGTLKANPTLDTPTLQAKAAQTAVKLMGPNIKMQMYFQSKAATKVSRYADEGTTYGWIQPPNPLPLPVNMSRQGMGILPVNSPR
jgi:hypothetical protein